MITKLTLTIEKTVIERAKDYAQKTGRSLSDLIESYLESIIQSNKDNDTAKLPAKLKRLFGATNISANLNHKKEIRKILSTRGK